MIVAGAIPPSEHVHWWFATGALLLGLCLLTRAIVGPEVWDRRPLRRYLWPGLAFALGMYLPMDLNSPLVVGAGVAWLLRRSSKDPAVASARHEKGTLVASGFIAGGALVGVLAALLRFFEDRAGVGLVPDLTRVSGIGPALAAWGNWTGLAAFLGLACWVYWVSRRAAREPGA
jgi:hypothetical protein